MKRVVLYFTFAGIVLFSSCTRSNCPAYDRTHTDRNYGYNPNNASRAANDNKGDIEARKKAELNPKRSKRSTTSLFPKGVMR